MTLPSSGPLTFTEIETEFGSNGNRGLGRYRADSIHFTNKTVGDLGKITEGGYLPLDDGIPRSGTIKFSDFRGKSQNVIVDCHSAGGDHINAKTNRWNTNDVLVVGGYKTPSQKKESGSKIIIHINKTFKSVHSNSANTCALRTGEWNSIAGMRVDLGDNAKLYGAGGNGGLGGDHGSSNGEAGKPGNSALGIEMNNTTVNVNSGALIQCGYGGGGGGGSARQEDPGQDRSAGGGGGGGGAGFPAGLGAKGGETGNTSGNATFSHGSDGNDGTQPAGGEEGGANGNGGDNAGEARGGHGGRGGDEENAPGTGGDDRGNNKGETEGGAAGGNGAAIRRDSGITVTINNSGSITGATNATGVA
tara:strand:- start:84 stop:1166 length:1083 start_codon:yes stop_codon:yes gene_type:complete